MNPFELRQIGSTDVRVTALGLGGSAYAGLFEVVSKATALETIHTACEAGVRYFDTAPLYGHGSSEIRLGEALRKYDRKSYAVSTKVGRVLDPISPGMAVESDGFAEALPYRPRFDFTEDGVANSFRGSLERLQLSYVDICLIHDPDQSEEPFEGDADSEARVEYIMASTWPAMSRLRDSGLIRAAGVGMNQWQMLRAFVLTRKFDCVLLAGRYTLLDQSALDRLMPACLEGNVSVIIGGPYNSGILASGPTAPSTYDYSVAPEAIRERLRQIQFVCDEHGVELRAAALQFPLAHPAVASVIPGARTAAEVKENVRLLRADIPYQFWSDLKRRGLIQAESPVPAAA